MLKWKSENVIGSHHHGGMAEPAGQIPRPRLQLSLPEARTRFVQLARMANLSQQSTVITDGGRPLAAIVPIHSAGDGTVTSDRSAAGWLRRIERLRAEFHGQQDVIIHALSLAWQELDRISPPGADSRVDALRLAHADLRRPR